MASSAPEEPVAGAASAAPALPRPRFNPGWGLVIVGGLLGVLGAFLTWATVDYAGLATHTYRGVSAGRDGKITVVLAVMVLGLTAAAFLGFVRGWLRTVLALLGLVIAFIAVADLAASPSVGAEEQARLHVTARVTSSNGAGEWLTLVAGILVVVGVALVGRYSRPRAAGAHAVRTASAALAGPDSAGAASAESASAPATSAESASAPATSAESASAAATSAGATSPAATSAEATSAEATSPAATSAAATSPAATSAAATSAAATSAEATSAAATSAEATSVRAAADGQEAEAQQVDVQEVDVQEVETPVTQAADASDHREDADRQYDG